MNAPEPNVDSTATRATATRNNGSPRSQRKRRLGLKLTLALLSLLCALGLAELGLRLLTPMQLGFECKDGRFTHPTEFTLDLTRNTLGYHDVEHGSRRPGVRRVVLLGDSYVGAGMVSIPETPARRLEHHLNARSKQPYEVIAIGKGGWGQREELIALRTHGIPAEPEIVVTLFLSLNDVTDNSLALRRRASRQMEVNRRCPPGVVAMHVDDVPLLLFRWSVLNQLIAHRLSPLLRDRSVDSIRSEYFVYARQEDEAWRQAWRKTETLILETQAAARSAGARYVVVSGSTAHGVWGPEEGLERLMAIYPGMEKLEWDLDKPDKRIARICRENDIPFLALEPLFRVETIEKDRQLHFQYDGHWNAAGNDLAARQIAELLLSLDARPAPESP